MVSSFLRSYPCLQKAQKWINCRRCVKNALGERGAIGITGAWMRMWGEDTLTPTPHHSIRPMVSANTGTISGESEKGAVWQMAAWPHLLLINQKEGRSKCTKQLLLVLRWLHQSCHETEECKEGWGRFTDLHLLQTQIYEGALLSPS